MFRFLIFILIAASQSLYGQQQNNVDVEFKKISVPDITSGYNNNYIFFSSDDLMWFSTLNGFVSFDGTQVTYHNQNQQQIKTLWLDNISQIVENKEGNFWILADTNTRDGYKKQLIYFDRRKGTFTVVNLPIPNLFSTDLLYNDENDNLWISQEVVRNYESSIQLYTFHLKNKTFKKVEIWQDSSVSGYHKIYQISCMVGHFSKRNQFWMGTDQGIFLLDAVTKKITLKFHFPQDESVQSITSIYPLNDSIISFSYCYGMGIYNSRTGETKTYPLIKPPYSDFITCVSATKRNSDEYYISLYGEWPAIFNFKTGKYLFIRSTTFESTFPDANVFLDKDGNCWVACEQGIYLNSSKSDLFETSDITVSPIFYGTASEKKKQFTEVYMSRYKSGVDIEEKKQRNKIASKLYDSKFSKHFKLLAENNYPDISRVPLDVLWDEDRKSYFVLFCSGKINSSVGVYELDSNFKFKKNYPVSLNWESGTDFESFAPITKGKLFKDNQGRLWFWTDEVNTALYVYTTTSGRFELAPDVFPRLTYLRDDINNIPNYINDVCLDKTGNLIFIRSNGTFIFLNAETLQTDSLSIKKSNPRFQNTEFDEGIVYDGTNDMVYAGMNDFRGPLTFKDSILQYNIKKREFKIFYPKEHIDDYCLDGEGNIWVTYDKNDTIFIHERKSFEIIKKIIIDLPGKRELYNTSRFTIVKGPRGYMWIQIPYIGIVLYNINKNESIFVDKSNGIELSRFTRSPVFSNNHLFLQLKSQFKIISFSRALGIARKIKPIVCGLEILGSQTGTFILNRESKINLDHRQNTFSISYSALEFVFPDRLQFAYRLIGVTEQWTYSDAKSRNVTYSQLQPGKYVFQLKAQMRGGNWESEIVEYRINITPAFWQTNWFNILIGFLAFIFIILIIGWRLRLVRKREQTKAKHEKELLELEAKALRAQMNPHFIFNSMNSIKSLINKNENDKAANYLTTFSKLIRTLFQNSDKREVSLYEELETCKLYTQLEKMRFGDKVEFVFNVDETIDLKDFKVPALILQPFIENAIWHGLIPKETGGIVIISMKKNDGAIQCIIDDNGIGREQSKQFKPQYEATYQSKGIGLTQTRLELDKLLNEREDTIFIIDKEDENGRSEGTKVIISFKENRN